MKYILLIPTLLLTGCFYQTVNEWDISDAEEICKEHGGTQVISSSFCGEETVTCKNGKLFSLHRGN